MPLEYVAEWPRKLDSRPSSKARLGRALLDVSLESLFLILNLRRKTNCFSKL